MTLIAMMLERWGIVTVSYCGVTSTYKALVAMSISFPCLCSLAEGAPLGWVLLLVSWTFDGQV